LQALGLWDDLNALLGVLGWQDYVQLRFPVYEKLVWEYFRSFTIDEAGEFNNGRCYIRFRLGDLIQEMNLARFSELLHLPVGGTTDFIHWDYHRAIFWSKITCNAPPYVSRSSKATSIYEPILRYLWCLTAKLFSLGLIGKGYLGGMNCLSYGQPCIGSASVLSSTS